MTGNRHVAENTAGEVDIQEIIPQEGHNFLGMLRCLQEGQVGGDRGIWDRSLAVWTPAAIRFLPVLPP